MSRPKAKAVRRRVIAARRGILLGNCRGYGAVPSRSPSDTIVNGDLMAAPAVGGPVYNPTSPAMSSPAFPTYIQTLPATYAPTSPMVCDPVSPTAHNSTSQTRYDPTKHYPLSLDFP